jgi:hypothetical protein
MHYFIDEAGDLEIGRGASEYFLIGCVTTDNPRAISSKLNALRRQIFESATLSRHWANFRKQGFHATSNHPDIYSRFIGFLNTAEFRTYFVIVKKGTAEFRNLIRRIGKEAFYDELVKVVLLDRIIKDNGDAITISFEQNLPRPTKGNMDRRRVALRHVVRQTIERALAKKRTARKPGIKVKLEDKISEPRLALVDYMDHVLLSYLVKKGRTPGAVSNYLLLEKKIGIIHNYLGRTFHQPRKNPFRI